MLETSKRGARIRHLIAVAAMMCATGVHAQGHTVDDSDREAARRLANYLCDSCHGREGRSEYPLFPSLAGQQASYLEAQLKAFRDKSRADQEAHDYMWNVAASLNDNIIKALAGQYAAQKPAAGKTGDTAIIAAGKSLFESGSSARKIPPCAACHGANAEGLSIFPRLAGQQGHYLNRQITMMKLKLRDSPIMHGVIKDLSDDEVFALATYLQSL